MEKGLPHTLRSYADRHPSELKAALVVNYGMHPEQAALIASDPLRHAETISSFADDLARYLETA
jgi:hypothetical protein